MRLVLALMVLSGCGAPYIIRDGSSAPWMCRPDAGQLECVDGREVCFEAIRRLPQDAVDRIRMEER